MLFSTRYKYFLNYKSGAATVDIPSVSHGAGVTTNYSVALSLDRTQDFTQVKINFSFDPTKWYGFPQGDVLFDTDAFSVSTVGAYSGSVLTITFYVVNQTGGTISNSAFTASVSGLLFVVPS